jgi:sigma-E factor negative regulatory protein RseB
MLVRVAFGLLSGLLLAPLAAAQSPSPAAADEGSALRWIQRMNEALATRNYDGVFMHVRGGRVETLRILHGVEDGTVRERLISLDGSGREFVRKGEELICYMPDQRTVVVEQRRDGASLLGALPNAAAATSENYELTPPRRERIMGRDARVVEIRPRDEFRFGYRLWIDEATAMPLKSQLCDGAGAVLEQIVFARLTLPGRIPTEAFQLPALADSFRWVRPEAAPTLADAGGQKMWNVMRLPPGFRLTTRGTQMLPGAAQPATHLVFSDGLATVSVFVEPSDPDARPPSGSGQVGLSSAYSVSRSGVQITAVGEVPLTTVRYFATQARPDAADAGESRPNGDFRPGTPALPQGIPALAPRTPPRR